MLAYERWRFERQYLAGIGYRAEGGVVDSPKPVGAVEVSASIENGAVVRGIRAHDHLRTLATGRETLWFFPGQRFVLALVDQYPQLPHGAADSLPILLRRQRTQACNRRQLDVDTEAVGIQPGTRHQFRAGIRNGLKMDIATEIVFLAQHARHFHHLLHRIVGVADDAGAQEEPFNIVAAVKAQGQIDHLLYAEPRTRHIAAHAVDAINAVVHAEISQQDFQQRNTAAIRRIAVAYAHACGRAYALAFGGGSLVGAAGGA